jgi:N-acetylneuraminic acid mutarotase
VYGTLGTASPGNKPGDRSAALGWTDDSGNLWLFGGLGKDGTVGGYGTSGYGFGDLNDLWMFNPVSNEWTWMAGSNTASAPAVYGVLGWAASSNTPGSREQSVGWKDRSGNLWLFGGVGIAQIYTFGFLNDLWMLSPSSGQWTWMDGIEQSGVYGTLQEPAYGNVPGGRQESVSWIDSVGNLWLFGGSGPYSLGYEGELNDLWVYQPLNASAATPAFSVAAGTYSAIQTVTLSDTTPGASIYYTTDGTAPTNTSMLYRGPITVAETETLQATAVARNYFNSAVASAAYVLNLPPDFAVSVSPVSMTVTAGGSGPAAVSIAPQGGFASAVSFACSGLPSGATCIFSPSTVTPTSAPAITELKVTTSAASAMLRGNRQPLIPEAALAITICVAGFRKRKSLRLLLLLGVSLTGLGLLSGCGGGSSGGGPQPVTSTVTVTATSGSLAHSTTFSLTVN